MWLIKGAFVGKKGTIETMFKNSMSIAGKTVAVRNSN